MSLGSPRVTFRVPAHILTQIEVAILRRNLHAWGPPWDVSDFVRIAIVEKLAKMERSRTKPRPQD